MEVWVWLTAYLIGFALLQLVLYRYVRADDSAHDEGSETSKTREPGYRRLERAAIGGESDRSTQAEVTAGTQDDGDGVICPHCGAVNGGNETFSYCRECAGALR